MMATAAVVWTASGYILAVHVGPFENEQDAIDTSEDYMALLAQYEYSLVPVSEVH